MYLNKLEFMGPRVITVGLSLVDFNIRQNRVITYITVSMYSLLIQQPFYFFLIFVKTRILLNYSKFNDCCQLALDIMLFISN